MSDQNYDEITKPVDPNDMNLFNPNYESMISEIYRVYEVYDTIDEILMYIVSMYNKCADDILLGAPIKYNNRHELNMYSLVDNFISLGYPKKLVVQNGTLKETNSTTNIEDFNKSLEMSIMSRLDFKTNDMERYGLPNDAFVQRNEEPEHYGMRVSYRFAYLPIAFQMKLPNMSIHSKALSFLNRFFYEFIAIALLRLYYCNFGPLIRQVLLIENGITNSGMVKGDYIVSCVYRLPVTDIKVVGTDAKIKQVDIKSVVSILDNNRTLIYPTLTINSNNINGES